MKSNDVPKFLQKHETTRHSENDTYIYKYKTRFKYKTQFCICKCKRLGTALVIDCYGTVVVVSLVLLCQQATNENLILATRRKIAYPMVGSGRMYAVPHTYLPPRFWILPPTSIKNFKKGGATVWIIFILVNWYITCQVIKHTVSLHNNISSSVCMKHMKCVTEPNTTHRCFCKRLPEEAP